MHTLKDAEAGGYLFEATLVYTVSSCLPQTTVTLMRNKPLVEVTEQPGPKTLLTTLLRLHFFACGSTFLTHL